MIKKYLIFLIFILAFILRFFELGGVPSSLDWDEASLGYNAYSILKTGKDEYGNFLPLSIRSFNDYKPPLYTYLTVIPVYFLGLGEFSTRFISAFFGTLSIIASYFLVKKLFPKLGASFSMLFTFFFAISPWHLQFSRVAFESNLALFFFIFAIYLLLMGLEKGIFITFSFVSFAFSIWAYHSPRLIVPAFIILFSIFYFKSILRKIYWYLVALLLFLLLVLPVYRNMTSTGARLTSVSVLNPDEKLGESIKEMEYDSQRKDLLGRFMHNRRIVFGREIIGGYLDHYNFDFLFLTGDSAGRHHAAGMGMLYFFDMVLIIFGILYILNVKEKYKMLIFIWFFLSPLASSLTSGTPHAVRALFYLPLYQIFSALGLYLILKNVKNIPLVMSRYFLYVSIVFIIILNFFYYLHMYYIHTPVEYASWWQYGYREAVETVRNIKSADDSVLVTYRYDQPYIYFLFYDKINPTWYQANWGQGEINRAGRFFGQFEFRNIDWDKDRNRSNTIMIGTASEIPENAAGFIKDIKYPDGSVVFRIIKK